MATYESLILDGLELNSGDYSLEAVQFPVPRKRAEWVSGADADGALLLRDPLFENREVTATIRVEQQASMDLALAKIGAVVEKVEEAEKQRDGLALVWTPATSTKSYTLYVLSGEVEDLPVEIGSGWFVRSPVFTVKLVCKPFGYGAEVVGSPTSSSLPLMTVEIPAVAGDVPAEARLIVTDNATQSRRHVEWGLEHRHYNAATVLLLDSDSLVTTGFAGTQQTLAGAYDPNADVSDAVRATVYAETIAVCGLGNLSHVGVFRMKARVHAADVATYVRLAWRHGDGPFTSNPFVQTHVEDGFCEVDLGLVSIPEKRLGTQRWTGQIEAYSDVEGSLFYVDAIYLIPAGEGYGKARTEYIYRPGVLTAIDKFTATTSGGALNARVAPVGGTWATSGATGDFLFVDAPDSGESVARTSVSDSGDGRFAILGSANFTNVEAGVRIYSTAIKSTDMAVVARYVDANNYLVLFVKPAFVQFQLLKKVAGTATSLATTSVSPPLDSTWYELRLIVYDTGQAIGLLLGSAGNTIAEVRAQDSVLATAGVLATGKPGFRDYFVTGSSSRYYDDFYVATPALEPIACYSGQSIEVRSNGDHPALREDPTGTYWGQPPAYNGSRFWLPEGGDEDRPSRVAVKARRNDIDTMADPNIADSTTVQVNHTPRYLAVPR